MRIDQLRFVHTTHQQLEFPRLRKLRGGHRFGTKHLPILITLVHGRRRLETLWQPIQRHLTFSETFSGRFIEEFNLNDLRLARIGFPSPEHDPMFGGRAQR
ncbi:MAG TPA: hypothetical protein VHS31_01810 [Tepidisphaeraceae bacterium]|nr:hypothetical protein [Tepidisphaeraceae bacterium]